MNTGKGTQPTSRWANRPNPRPPSHAANEDDLAMAALLGEATARARSEEEEREQQRGANRPPRPQHHRGDDPNDRYRRSGDKRIVEDDGPTERDSKPGKRRRWNDREEAPYEEALPDNAATDDASAAAENPNKVKANFGLSGALANDTQTGNVYNGVTLKFSEPPEARIPNTRWRLYVFRKKAPDASSDPNKKDDGLIDTYHISRQSAYLFGRERKVADIPVDHTSLSKQHAVLQYRALPSKQQQQMGAPDKLQCKPYLMDLESTNGTFINGVRLDPARYYELRRGDVITFGASSREYVLLTEQSAKTGI
mmetsp:Transcript_25282/g.45522  ORF Transcript_25282/g.45522 Transcript_25282/m.45522 type:complete len:310 (+) Transcript_25282:35-964(+)|eukprot:CAMPEP_0201870026 /NCGR_PEP_ID=MMETSP0902-20130614/3303_1 /ASSEMBLY_ACC=CAM_ASM_000551 /TAXON_ID=420261 /ORGANISM="Thalassiosira antarctica, Strain CCMP982" /LENGTH=309 /DNA_ID=CAMNT_0048395597 /DNA_START=17 /DNA_END=946 /DNA_ORIENTATION=-